MQGGYIRPPCHLSFYPYTLAKKQKRSTLALDFLAVGLLLSIYARICQLINVPLLFILLYPVSVILSSILMVDSALKATFGKSVNWKGRRIVVD
jgi:hypothetical protein